jgi:putative zinc finger/helix-turn-helix YgiT family protein
MNPCAECKCRRVRKGVVEESLTVGGVTFKAALPASICRGCGTDYVSLDDLARFELAVGAWLGDHGVRTPETFRFMRKALGLKAADLAALLDLTPETISRWENGKGTIDLGAFALLGKLIADQIAGTDDTITLLRTIRTPGKPPSRPVALKLPKAS